MGRMRSGAILAASAALLHCHSSAVDDDLAGSSRFQALRCWRAPARSWRRYEAVLTSTLYPAPDMLRPTQMSHLLLMALVDPLPFAGLMTIGLYARIAAHRLSGHTAAASSVGWPVPSAWRGTALCSGRAGRCQCACSEGACSQAGDHRFGQHCSSAEPSIVLENGPRFALAYVYFEAEPSRRSGGESSPHGVKAATTAKRRGRPTRLTSPRHSALESDGNSGSHAPNSHVPSPLGIPSGIQMSDAIH